MVMLNKYLVADVTTPVMVASNDSIDVFGLTLLVLCIVFIVLFLILLIRIQLRRRREKFNRITILKKY